jgi:hypothetical protein
MNVELTVNVLEVGVHRSQADVQRRADFLVRPTARQELQEFLFAMRQEVLRGWGTLDSLNGLDEDPGRLG